MFKMQKGHTDTSRYSSVASDENQQGPCSIWLHDMELPLGWKQAHRSGSKEKCLNYISELWSHLHQLNPSGTTTENQSNK